MMICQGGGYYLYNDGYIVQYGIMLFSSGTGNRVTTLYRPMRDINYQIHINIGDNTGTGSFYANNFNAQNIQYWNKTTSSFTQIISTASLSFGRCWRVEGYSES